MNINLDDKRIKKIIYELSDSSVVAYNFRNGELWCVQTLKDAEEDISQKPLTDTEMINAVKNSEFMNELNKAREKYKLSKEIDETFPEKDDSGNIKDPAKKTSDESIGIIKEIIKKDMDGTLDDIIKRKFSTLDYKLKEIGRDDSDKQYELDKCNMNIHTIENKLLDILRKCNGNMDEVNEKKFNEVLDDYSNYCNKRKELSDEVWNIKTEDCQKSS